MNNDLIPANYAARVLFLIHILWKDILVLSELCKNCKEPKQMEVLDRHILTDFYFLDEMIKKREKELIFSTDDENRKSQIKIVYSEYHKIIQPKREILYEIRNDIGAHITSMPHIESKKNKSIDQTVWGLWENKLKELKNKCNLEE